MARSQSQGFGDWFKEQQESEAGQNDQVPSMFSSVFDKTRSDAQGLLPQFMRPQESRSEVEQLVMGLSYAQRFRWFIVTLLMSVGFFALSFFVCLPVIVLRPHKFAFAFTLGSLCFTSSFAFLRGPAAHCKSTCSVERMPLTAAYWLSMVATLYACMVLRSYFFVVLTSALQLLALLWYFVSYAPGGSAGMKYVLSAMAKMARFTIVPCCKGLLSSFRLCCPSPS